MARAKSTTALLQIMARLVADERRERGLKPSLRGRRRGLSRRAFLGGTLGAAGVAACGGPAEPVVPPQPRPSPEPAAAGKSGPVIVVGAGTAGLLCAYRLHQAKVPVRLIEASSRPGGRMFTDRKTFGPELNCELGGELVDTNHETMHALVKELGLTLDDLKGEADLHEVFHFGGKAHSEKDVTEALRPAAAAMTKDLESLEDYEDTPYESGKLTQALDAMSIDSWLKARGITGLAGDLLRVAFTTELGLEADELSPIIMFEMFRLEADKLELFGDSDERYRIRGGNDQIPRILADKLGKVVEYESRLTALRRAADGRLELDFDGPAGAKVTSERVVLALPFSLLRQIPIDDSVGLSERKKRSIAELGYGTNAKLMLGFSTRFWTEKKKNGEFFGDGAYQSGWETSRMQPGTEGILTVYTGGKQGVAIGEGTPEAARDAMLDALAPVFPGAGKASNGKVARFHWPTSPLALGSYSTFKVGQLTAFGGVESEVEGKNLHFAGEHTSLDFQGFMEGAAESGERAAREVIEALRGA